MLFLKTRTNDLGNYFGRMTTCKTSHHDADCDRIFGVKHV